ncbi:MAG: hypothetical protein Q9190_006902 [Brigantiaea leucoxantha]
MLSLHFAVLVACVYFGITNGFPLQDLSTTLALSVRSRLAKRTNPIIGQGIDINDPQKGGKLVPRPNFPTSGAFSNAQEMLAYAVFTPEVGIDSNSPIFTHYFLEEHRDRVKRVMLRLMGNPASMDQVKNDGAAELGQITFQGIDTPNTGDDAGCDREGTIMYTEYYDTNSPVTVVCDDAWVFPDRDDQRCDTLGDRLTDDFAILGHLVLHEYTHWDWFLQDITQGEIVDDHGDQEVSGYGLENAYFDLDKQYAVFNADSYAWYATEVLWSVLCSKSYAAPSDDDSN